MLYWTRGWLAVRKLELSLLQAPLKETARAAFKAGRVFIIQ
jgi:hypothetical protein